MSWKVSDEDASIPEDAIVYRIAPIDFSNQEHMLSTKMINFEGRWHRPQQNSTYTSNNVIVCMAEVLFHNYRRMLDGVRDRRKPSWLRSCYRKEKVLQIARVRQIGNLAHLESEDFRRQYDLWGMAAVHPDPCYSLYHNINDDLRRPIDEEHREGKRSGVVYPSARHSRDFCAALFRDESGKIKDFWCLSLVLSLVHEDQLPGTPLISASPERDKIHQTMGYYSFDALEEFNQLDRQGLIHPAGLPPQGFIEFVRRGYADYPTHAVWTCGEPPKVHPSSGKKRRT